MVKKKAVKKKVVKKKSSKKPLKKERLNSESNKSHLKNSDETNQNNLKKPSVKKFPTLKIEKETDIAMDFATKVYERFDKIVKSVILFGSTTKKTDVSNSDIDIVIIIDDVSINWSSELIVWYREELDRILRKNPYDKKLHINTIKLSTWWEDLMRGDPVVINVIRYGEAMLDFGGFFEPLKFLLLKGKIRATPEAIYNSLKRAPQHIARSKMAELSSIEGVYWSMVDSAHAALISRGVLPPSPEHIPLNLKEKFVDEKRLKMKYVSWYKDLSVLHKKISRGEIRDLKGVEIDLWQERAEEFLREMSRLVGEMVESDSGFFEKNRKFSY